jgi:molybdate transport system substrate-binding protein
MRSEKLDRTIGSSGLAGSGLASLALLVVSACEAPSTSEGVRIFAASSLQGVLERVVQRACPGQTPAYSFASSAELARQIEQGARADLFWSADGEWMDYLADRSLVDSAQRIEFPGNALVLIAPADRPLNLELSPGADLVPALKGGRLALADPDSVPAGRYAREALTYLGAWDALASTAARAPNVRAALRFVETGEAAAGVVYATDARAAGGRIALVGQFPAEAHRPIRYALAPVRGSAAGGELARCLTSPQARLELESAGFDVTETVVSR